MRERSLEIFGDEKRLDALTTTTLFAPGRLTLTTLFTERIPPPLAYEHLGDGGIVLVIENSDTFATVSTLLTQDAGRVGYVAFGGGHAFEASVTRIANLKGVTDIAYYGDLDDDGLTIPQRANASGTASKLPPVRPARGLYRLLLRQNIQGPAPKRVDPLAAERRVAQRPTSSSPVTGSPKKPQEQRSSSRTTHGATTCSRTAATHSQAPGQDRASDPRSARRTANPAYTHHATTRPTAPHRQHCHLRGDVTTLTAPAHPPTGRRRGCHSHLAHAPASQHHRRPHRRPPCPTRPCPGAPTDPGPALPDDPLVACSGTQRNGHRLKADRASSMPDR
ncbi:Wadjet anti-phage system protein JetD domain-containing protein [Streptomyces collinus]|uniref:Wadjet anti-phage system protein JetD domain-containing protein n=1 Tax=Streptomyces collinus TaxID=42684 RepID=UPI00344357E6